jgi:hypothetical protein
MVISPDDDPIPDHVVRAMPETATFALPGGGGEF